MHETGTPPELVNLKQHVQPTEVIEEKLDGPFILSTTYREIAPSRSVIPQHINSEPDEDAKNRGIIIHLMLEKLSERPALSLQQLAQQLPITAEQSLVDNCWEEVQQVLQASQLASIFNPVHFEKAMNEVSVIYQQQDACVHGIIDRLIIHQDKIVIIDYKSHQHARKANLASLSEPYHQQIALYVEGIKQLWPKQPVEAYLLFTHCAELHKMSPAG